ncbi:hypothetical protein [Vibrio sp. CUB2]|uniref:hypothetical protein n=1 Tax=Vibrio sp. CUB2 TaxID=2315233 RepID=UPI00076A4520|nr:hypothetical protein [Vibrio sp. CUB2]
MRDSNGRFAAGNTYGTGRKIGSENRLTKLIRERLELEANNDTFHVGDFLIEVVKDEDQPAELRAKCDSKLLDIVAKTEDEVTEKQQLTPEEMDLRIAQLLSEFGDKIVPADWVCHPPSEPCPCGVNMTV